MNVSQFLCQGLLLRFFLVVLDQYAAQKSALEAESL